MSRIKLQKLDVVNEEVAVEEMKSVFGGQWDYFKAPSNETLAGVEVRNYSVTTTVKTTVEISTTMKGKAWYAKSVLYHDKDKPHLMWD